MPTATQKRKKEQDKRLRTIPMPEIQTLEGGDLEVAKMLLEVVGSRTEFDITDSIISGEILLSINGSPQVTVTVHDQKRVILRSGALENEDGQLRAVDVRLDGLWWRLTAQDKQGDDLVLTLEDRNIAWLRGKDGPRKAASRAKVTRAQYILSLIRSVKKRKIPVSIPELNKVQPIAKADPKKKKSKKEKEQDRDGGFDTDTKIEGINADQMRRIEEALGEADRHKGATDRVKLAMLVAMAGESNFGEDRGKRGTTFQTTQIPESEIETQAKHFLIGGRSFRAGGAINAAKNNPSWTVGKIASYVEVSDQGGAHYDKHRGIARRVLDKWHGEDSSSSSSSSTTLYKRYEFKVEKDENYWDAIVRMADEVKWRAFFSGGRFYYMSEDRLYAAPARYHIREGENGVSNIDFRQDSRKRVQTATVSCRLDRWAAPPGTVIVVEEGINVNGSQRWLVESVRRNLFSAEAEITLKRKNGKRKEPRSEEYTKEDDEDGGGSEKRGDISGDTSGLTDDMVRFCQEIAGETDEAIKVISGQRKYDSDSNHQSGNAADLDVGGDARSNAAAGRKGDNIAIAALIVCGHTRSEARRMLGGPRTSFSVNSTWRGYDVEIGWRTEVGGNHFNHVHVGFDNGVEKQRQNRYQKSKDNS